MISRAVQATFGAIVLTSIGAAAPRTNHPPTVTIEILGDRLVDGDFILPKARVRVDDADGDRVTASLVLGQNEFTMRPIVNEVPPVTRELFVKYLEYDADALPFGGGLVRLVVHAHDAAAPAAIVRAEATLEIGGAHGGGADSRACDLDGDDLPEIAVADPRMNVNGVVDAGAIVLANAKKLDANGAPTRTYLVSSTPTANGKVGGLHGFQQVDLDGDGKLDVIAASFENGFKLHFWSGGLTYQFHRADDAQLVAPSFGTPPTNAAGWLRFADVTGDGVLDVVAAAPNESTVAANAGAIFVWAGGPSLRGTVLPTATLRLSSSVADDRLGGSTNFFEESSNQHLLFHDVNGDGILDVVCGAPDAKRNGLANLGLVGVWAGGSGWSGTILPTAELTDWSPSTPIRNVGVEGYGRSARFGDLDGDGHDDVVVVAHDSATTNDLFLVWRGGAALAGQPAPLAKLKPSAGKRSSFGGDYYFPGHGRAFIEDWNHDGIADVVGYSASTDLDANGRDDGAAFVWYGRATLAGTVASNAVLRAPGPEKDVHFGSEWFMLIDLDGDSVRDVAALTQDFDVGSATDAGAIHVWKGGVTYSGTPAPSAEWTARNPTSDIRLGSYPGVDRYNAVRAGDVTGDGITDLVAMTDPDSSKYSSGGILPDAMIAMVFAGGSLTGNAKARFDLYGPGGAFESCGFDAVADVTGDGIDDVVMSSPSYLSPVDFYGPTGNVVVWSCAASTRPDLRPTANGIGRHLDRLGYGDSLADLNHDGVLDLLVAAPYATFRGAFEAGRAELFCGGPRLSGDHVSPTVTFEREVPAKFDRFSWSGNLIGDFDADGFDDVAIVCPEAKVVGRQNVGAIVWFPNALPTNRGGGIEILPAQLDRDHYFGQ